MSKLELHPLAELRDDAAELLTDRYARQRAAEPLLPQIDGLEPHLPTEGLAAARGRQTERLAARFWRKRGFRPTYLRLYRAIS